MVTTLGVSKERKECPWSRFIGAMPDIDTRAWDRTIGEMRMDVPQVVRCGDNFCVRLDERVKLCQLKRLRTEWNTSSRA